MGRYGTKKTFQIDERFFAFSPVLRATKGIAEIEMSENKYLHWVLPPSLSRCIFVVFNTWAAHYHSGSSLNATVEAGKEPALNSRGTSQNHRESQDTLSWKGPTGITEFNIQPCIGHPHESRHVLQSIVQTLLELCQVWCRQHLRWEATLAQSSSGQSLPLPGWRCCAWCSPGHGWH